MNIQEFRSLVSRIVAHSTDDSISNLLLQAIAEYTAATSFTDGKHDTPDRQDAGLGIAIADWADWEGDRILRVAFNALQDANFHREAAQVQQMLDNLNAEEL